MAYFNNIKSAQSLRRMKLNGKNSSEQINDSFEEILHDLAELFLFVNQTIIPVLNGLGAPGTYVDINPYEGLDGKVLLTDNSFTDTDNVYFYNSAQGRPKTVNETSIKLTEDIDQLFINVNNINARIGTVSQNSDNNPATLAEIENQLNYFIGITRLVESNTEEYLTASEIATAINDQTINPASFNIGRNDITANAGIKATDISGVADITASFDYSSGEPSTYDLDDSIMRVKSWVEDVSGDSLSLGFANSGLTGDSLKTHRDKLGTGIESSTNPHGNDIDDFEDSQNKLSRITQIAHFTISSGVNITAEAGYVMIPANYTATKIGIIAADGGSGSFNSVIKNQAGSQIATLTLPAGTPGSAVNTSISIPTLNTGDYLYLEGTEDSAARQVSVFLWGTPS